MTTQTMTFRFSVHDTCISVWADDPTVSKQCFARILIRLRRQGFTVGLDERINEHYPSLNHSHRGGTHASGLEFQAEFYPRGCKVEFFQNVNFVNPNGGRFDFDKLEKMPYLLRLRFEKAVRAIKAAFAKCGGTFDPPNAKYTENPLQAFNDVWDGEFERKRGIHRFKRDSSGWPDESELKSWKRADSDGFTVNQGEHRYVQIRGRWVRCQVWGGINGMWICVYGKDGITCVNVARLKTFYPGRGRRFEKSYRQQRLAAARDKSVKAKQFLRADAICKVMEAMS